MWMALSSGIHGVASMDVNDAPNVAPYVEPNVVPDAPSYVVPDVPSNFVPNVAPEVYPDAPLPSEAVYETVSEAVSDAVSDAPLPYEAIPAFDGNIPTAQELVDMLDSMTGISDEEKASLKEDLMNNIQGDAMPVAAGNDPTMQTLILLSLLSIVVLIFVFFVYKLFKCLREREAKREEKKKNKELKKKK